MPAHALFPTLIYTAKLAPSANAQLNERILKECRQLARQDRAGQHWSRSNYPGGYTSYNSVCRMHEFSPTFAELAKRLARHVNAFSRSLELDLDGRELAMTDCWVNVMPFHVSHSLHLHPLSTISGTYYVKTPRGCTGLKFEDPRLDRFMAVPPQTADRQQSRGWHTVPARAGELVLFESWLRHEVPPNPARGERVSISFNYNWF